MLFTCLFSCSSFLSACSFIWVVVDELNGTLMVTKYPIFVVYQMIFNDFLLIHFFFVFIHTFLEFMQWMCLPHKMLHIYYFHHHGCAHFAYTNRTHSIRYTWIERTTKWKIGSLNVCARFIQSFTHIWMHLYQNTSKIVKLTCDDM